MEEALNPEQQAMIGAAVNFNVSHADPFTTRTTYNASGAFNEGDLMMIYRQYTKDNGVFDWQNEIFRVYNYSYKTAPGTSVVLERDWKVYEGRKKGDYTPDAVDANKRNLTLDVQSKGDSLTWENGKTVRFRAWSRSNLSGALTSGSKSSYYPDYCVSDWVTVSGPTSEIPLSLKHLGCRLTFFYRNNGNRLQGVEITYDPDDYMREDNASDLVSDAADKFPVTATDDKMSATDAAAAVKAAYEKMCMPAGVNIETGLLKAMTKTAYSGASDLTKIEEWEYEDGTPKLVYYGDKSTEEIATDVQRPLFASNDSRYYLVTIPYDMSSGVTGGEPIVLPPWTRFKVWLYDVNNGDQGTGSLESQYHIFSLSDIKDGDNPLYPDGLTLLPGYSYEFRVGYRYNQLTITPGDSFSWDQQDAAELGYAPAEEVEIEPTTTPYGWWSDAIKKAVEETQGSKNYNPEFHIKSEAEFLEFIKLVNGDAVLPALQNGPIYRKVKEYETSTNANGTITKTPKTYGWSTVNDEKNAKWVDKSELLQKGYIFYEHYYRSNANRDAYSEEDYLQTPFSFFDEDLSRHFTVYLDVDLDLQDMKINSIGRETVTLEGSTFKAAFKGYFDGYSKLSTEDESALSVHKIKNLNVEGNYLFNFVSDASIRNLQIETTHTVGLLNEAKAKTDNDAIVGWGCYIAGISIKANNKPIVVSADSTKYVNAIAHSLMGPSVVVGCIHEGDAAGALVGEASDLQMYGCMRTAGNIAGAALLGGYLTGVPGAKKNFFSPQISLSAQKRDKNFSKKPVWGVFMCNYYNKDSHDVSKNAVAVGSTADDYSVLEYIRGRQSRILRAVYDNMLSREVMFSTLSNQQIEEYYGLAPWKAMNYAIYKYNTEGKGRDYPCKVHYEVNENGYDHLYPYLTSGAPTDACAAWDVLTQNN